MDRIIAETKHIRIERKTAGNGQNVFVLWWFEESEQFSSTLSTRAAAFRMAYTLIREYRKQESGYYDCLK